MFSKLGRFEIKDVLGRGAMGEVYLGVDPVLGREVAIKTILSSALPEDQARQRFDREAKAAAVLNSPNIVTIHELGEDQGVLFIAMERLKGQDLEQILLQRSLTLVESLEVLAQVCDGLEAAHRNHIIHRDIKPSNIMVMREGRKLLVKIMDFGVARLKDSAMTLIGTVVGTVNYIAPEYIRSGEPDARSDLFAVGVMLYECIAGRKPFEGGSASTVLFKIVNDPPDPLDLSMLHGLNPALRNMTERSLAKDPEDRFQTAEEFALALRAAKDPTWNGKVEETTVRMKIRPLEPERLPDQTVPTVVPIVPDSSSPTGAASNSTGSSAITQEVDVPPIPEPVKPSPAFKTVAITLPMLSEWAPPAKSSTPTPASSEVAAAKAGTQEIDVPLAAKTEILKLPEADPAPKLSAPAISSAEAAASKAGTQEILVPPVAKTEILKLPEPMPSPASPIPAIPSTEVVPDKAGAQAITAALPLIPSLDCQAAKPELINSAKIPRPNNPREPQPVQVQGTEPDLPSAPKSCPGVEASAVKGEANLLEAQKVAAPLSETPLAPAIFIQEVMAEVPAAKPEAITLSRILEIPQADEPTRNAPELAAHPKKSPLLAALGLAALVVLGGLVYFFFRSRAIPSGIAPVAPPQASAPAPAPPVIAPATQLPAPPPAASQPIPPAKPPAGRTKQSKVPVKVSPPESKAQEPNPVPEATFPPPPVAVVPPPPPAVDPKTIKKLAAEEAARRRKAEKEESSRK